MSFTGRVVSAVEALEWGLVTRVVPQDACAVGRGGGPRGWPLLRLERHMEVKRIIGDGYGTVDRMTDGGQPR